MISRDVKFEEGMGWNWGELEDSQNTQLPDENSETTVRGGEEENMNGVETGTSSLGGQAQANGTDELASEAGRMIDTGQ